MKKLLLVVTVFLSQGSSVFAADYVPPILKKISDLNLKPFMCVTTTGGATGAGTVDTFYVLAEDNKNAMRQALQRNDYIIEKIDGKIVIKDRNTYSSNPLDTTSLFKDVNCKLIE